MSGKDPDTDRRSGLLRAVMAEGAFGERMRIHDALCRLLENPPRGAGAVRRALDAAIAETAWLPPDQMPYEHHTGGACSPHLIDTVDVGWTDDPNDEGDPDAELPVRMFVQDGADSSMASPYLTIQDARDVAEALTLAADQAAAAQARRLAEQ